MRLPQGFQGVDYSTKGDRGSGPVQFEKDPVEADPFGLDQIISEASTCQAPSPPLLLYSATVLGM